MIIRCSHCQRRNVCFDAMLLSPKNMLFHKFMEQVENIFNNLPKPLKWQSFYENDLPILMDTSETKKAGRQGKKKEETPL